VSVDLYPGLSAEQSSAVNAAGAQFNVDPRLIVSVYDKESSAGTNPSGIGASDPFHAFGLISGPGAYDGYGYVAQGNTFADAADTVAAFISSTRADYLANKPNEPFLQFFDNTYSPPGVNPNSYPNLVSAYSSLGGDPTGEATYSGGNLFSSAGTFIGKLNPFNGSNWKPLGDAAAQATGVPAAIDSATQTVTNLALIAGVVGVSLALIAGGIAILAGSGGSSKPVPVPVPV
jgi:hypothetical protein